MVTWLVCPTCGIKEWLQPSTKIIHCKLCGTPRHAENDAGQPMVLWSEIGDPTDWSTPCGTMEIPAS